jgi:hypothetical protein
MNSLNEERHSSTFASSIFHWQVSIKLQNKQENSFCRRSNTFSYLTWWEDPGTWQHTSLSSSTKHRSFHSISSLQYKTFWWTCRHFGVLHVKHRELFRSVWSHNRPFSWLLLNSRQRDFAVWFYITGILSWATELVKTTSAQLWVP